MSTLEIENLHTGYGDFKVLKGVDMSVGQGEIVALIGPNGAGKSTIFKAVMGYIHPWEGEITFESKNIGHFRPSKLVQKGVGYVPQNQNVFPKMTVAENLRMGGFTVESDELAKNTETVYELFPTLEKRQDQKVATMSGGEQKMVAMARALVSDPEIVLFDEPSAGLMPKYVDDVFEKVKSINQNREVPFLIIEQNVDVLLRNSDRAYVIREGEMQVDESSDELLDDPRLRSAFLGGSGGGEEG